MKVIFSLFCAFCAFGTLAEGAKTPDALSPYMKKCSVKSSRFDRWVVKETRELLKNSFVVETANGPIEYVWHGEGPVVLSLHGGFGGWDQGLVIVNNFIDDGFSVLSVSRPGYLGTPLPPLAPGVEFTAAQQAALIVALLDNLNIPQVIVLGFSAGAPVAFELAKNYPNRVTGLVLESIGQEPGDSLAYDVLAGILVQPILPDFVTYLLYLSTHVDFNSTAKIALSQDTSLTGAALANRTHFVLTHSSQHKFLKKMLLSTMPVSPRLPGILNDFLGVNYWESPAFNPVGFSVPTVIVQALDDDNGYYLDAVNVNAQITGSQLITVTDSGHFIWLGPQTKAWQKQVTEFMKAHPPAGYFKPNRA